MSSHRGASEANLKLARKLNEETRADPAAPLAGKFVGIMSGQVVASADDLDGLVQRLHEVGAELCETLCLEVGLDYDQVQTSYPVMLGGAYTGSFPAYVLRIQIPAVHLTSAEL